MPQYIYKKSYQKSANDSTDYSGNITLLYSLKSWGYRQCFFYYNLPDSKKYQEKAKNPIKPVSPAFLDNHYLLQDLLRNNRSY